MIGVLIIQTLNSTILFLGVPSAQSPVFFALVVVLVVIVQSPRLRQLGRRIAIRDASRSGRPTPRSEAEVGA